MLQRSPDAIDARRRYLKCPSRTRPPRQWTAAEDGFVRSASAARVPSAEIARRLRRTTYALRRRRELLQATRPASRRYRADEDEALAATLVAGGSLAALGLRLGRSEGALRVRARALGLTDCEPRPRWSRVEDDSLRAAYARGQSTKQIQRGHLPHRTVGAIVARAHLLGLAVHARRWTAEEEARLRRLVDVGVSAVAIGRRLERSEEAIRNRCRRLQIGPPLPTRRTRSRRWTPAEDQLLRERDGDPPALLAVSLDRRTFAIRRRRRQLQLPGGERSQHHPLVDVAIRHAEQRLIARELPLTPTRALALSQRAGLQLSEIRLIARQISTRADTA